MSNAARKQIDKRQIKKIHTLKSVLKLSEEEYRLRIQGTHGFSMTSKDLSYSEAEELIQEMEAEAIEKGVWKQRARKYADLGKRPGMASPAQLRMIEAMWRDVSYIHDVAKRQLALRRFSFRITGVEDMRFLTGRDAIKVIKAIGTMAKAKAEDKDKIKAEAEDEIKKGEEDGKET